MPERTIVQNLTARGNRPFEFDDLISDSFVEKFEEKNKRGFWRSLRDDFLFNFRFQGSKDYLPWYRVIGNVARVIEYFATLRFLQAAVNYALLRKPKPWKRLVHGGLTFILSIVQNVVRPITSPYLTFIQPFQKYVSSWSKKDISGFRAFFGMTLQLIGAVGSAGILCPYFKQLTLIGASDNATKSFYNPIFRMRAMKSDSDAENIKAQQTKIIEKFLQLLADEKIQNALILSNSKLKDYLDLKNKNGKLDAGKIKKNMEEFPGKIIDKYAELRALQKFLNHDGTPDDLNLATTQQNITRSKDHIAKVIITESRLANETSTTILAQSMEDDIQDAFDNYAKSEKKYEDRSIELLEQLHQLRVAYEAKGNHLEKSINEGGASKSPNKTRRIKSEAFDQIVNYYTKQHNESHPIFQGEYTTTYQSYLKNDTPPEITKKHIKALEPKINIHLEKVVGMEPNWIKKSIRNLNKINAINVNYYDYYHGDILEQLDIFRTGKLSTLQLIQNLGHLQQIYYLKALELTNSPEKANEICGPQQFSKYIHYLNNQFNSGMPSMHPVFIVADRSNPQSIFAKYTESLVKDGEEAANRKLEHFLYKSQNLPHGINSEQFQKAKNLYDCVKLMELGSKDYNILMRKDRSDYDPKVNALVEFWCKSSPEQLKQNYSKKPEYSKEVNRQQSFTSLTNTKTYDPEFDSTKNIKGRSP